MTNFGDFRLTVFGQFNPTLTTVTADSAVKKQEEFEAMKKKTRNMLLGLVAVIVVAVAGIAAYKAMH